MSDASITFEDVTQAEQDGADAMPPHCKLKLIFSGGFNAHSPAHQAAQALLKLWDRELGIRLGTPIVDPVVATPEAMLAIPEGASAIQPQSR